MSVQSAMRAGVAGLAAQSAKMAAISDNIANSQTVGYKRTGVDFSTLVMNQGGTGSYQAGGVAASARTEVSKIGVMQAGSATTDMAISGQGFFVVSNGDGSDSMSLTRAGSFRPDAEGNLKNTANKFLMGWPIGPDGTAGSPSFDDLTGLQLVNTSSFGLSAQATTEISFTGNVPSNETGPGAPTAPFRSSIEYYDALGNSQRLFTEWLPSATVANQWKLTVTDSAGAAYGSVDVTFNAADPGAGSPAGYNNVVSTTPGFTVDTATGKISLDAAAASGTQPLTISFGTPGQFDGVSQFSGDYSPKTTKNGAAVGTLTSVEIDEKGMLVGVFSNNARRNLYQIPLAFVTNPDGLTATDGNTYQVSANSGDVRLANAGSGSVGVIAGGALETSTVDLATELTDMIVTQRAYSTNAKVIQTADEMLTEVTQLKR